MTAPAGIAVVEPNDALHGRIVSEFEKAATSPHCFTLARDLSEVGDADLAIVATAAAHRRAVVDEILSGRSVSVMILEKVLFQTTGDLDSVGALLDTRGVAGFVNCGRRTFPGYQTLRSSLAGTRPVNVTVRGRQFGLASNAVHFLDLAEYLNDDVVVDLDVSGLQPGFVPAKRTGCVELFGSISARLGNGARLVVECLDVAPVHVEVLVESSAGTIVIDELDRTIADGGGALTRFRSQNVSETPEIYQQALESGHCVLTPYSDSARQHRFVLDAFRDHLGLSPNEDVPCPIS